VEVVLIEGDIFLFDDVCLMENIQAAGEFMIRSS
jgi:hypothetical protein